MALILRTSRDVADIDARLPWIATTGAGRPLDPAAKFAGIAERLESAFESTRETWWRIGRELSAEPGGEFAHMPTAGSFGSDFGVMLAWAQIAAELAADDGSTVMLCDDPWLFRHLASLPGVDAGAAPPLAARAMRLALRGWLARLRLAFRLSAAAWRFRGHARKAKAGARYLLVYGHPESTRDGIDAYFGPLMNAMPDLLRMLHTDADVAAVRRLADGKRTLSLHSWGGISIAIALPFVRWRPCEGVESAPYAWLVRRAAAIENGGGGAAMNRWQQECQRRWLKHAAPDVVLWPWENHGWERALCRDARTGGVATVGYQHTVIGPHQFNYAVHSNWDGADSLPDCVACDGPAYMRELAAMDVPEDRLRIMGAFRFPRHFAVRFAPDGPVFVPLSAVGKVAQAQLKAAQRLAAAKRTVLVKEHPMYPCPFEADENLRRTEVPFRDQACASLVLYATGASGLEAVLAGVPAVRLLQDDTIAIDTLPAGHRTRAVTFNGIADVLSRPPTPPACEWTDILSEPDLDAWRSLIDNAKAMRRPTTQHSTTDARPEK